MKLVPQIEKPAEKKKGKTVTMTVELTDEYLRCKELRSEQLGRPATDAETYEAILNNYMELFDTRH